MKLFSHLKTSEKISLSFTLMSFFSIFVFLILINISYFFIWYSEQEEKSFSTMNQTYQNYLSANGKMEEVEAFKTYLLSKDTLIIPLEGALICSPGVAKKVTEDISEIQNKYFYKDGDIVYFIYSKYFENIGEVKVFFDTTPYIHSQMIILKIWVLFMFLVLVFQFLFGKIITKFLLRDLQVIARKLEFVDINSDKKHIFCNLPKHDEIRILAEALNLSYDTIDIQTQKLKQFLTDVSHEFKTPLMILSSRLDVLEKKSESQKISEIEIQDFFWDIHKHIEKLNKLLQTLFFLTRLEEKNTPLKKQKIDVYTFIKSKVEEVQKNFLLKNIKVHYTISPSLYYEVEENTFAIILENLLTNAFKFSQEAAEIFIEADMQKYSIRDQWKGIEPWDMKHIWEKFYRKDTSIEGFGIGLYLVKRIADISGFYIDVISQKWKWSTFTLFLHPWKKSSL